MTHTMDARVNDEPPFTDERAPASEKVATTTRAPSGLARLGRVLRLLLMVILPIALLVGGFAGFAWLRATAPTVPVERQGERARAIGAVIAEPGAVQPTLTVYGRIVAGRSVDIRPLVAGLVVDVSESLVDGARIAAGEPLVTIDPFAYEGALVRARADLAEARARLAEIEARTRQETDAIARAREQLDIARRDFDRLSQLREGGVSTARAFDDAQLRLSQSEAALEQRENQLAVNEAQRAQVEASLDRLAFAVSQAERNLADTVVRAPFDALVSTVGVEVGKLVSTNDAIATLVATERLEARFLLSDSQYAGLAQNGELVGRPISVTWRAGEVAVTREATIARVAARAEDASFAVFARFDDGAESDVLRPGAFVEARLADRVFDDAMVLPVAALYDGGVFVVTGESRLARVEVEVLTWGEEGVVVRAPDIAPGTQILATRLTAATAGQLVEVRP